MKALLTWLTIGVLAGSLMAQTSTTGTTSKKRARKAAAPPPPPAVTVDDLNALKSSLAQQQQQIQDLQGKMAERDATLQQTQQQLQQAQSQLQDAQSKASSAASTATQTSDSVTKLQSDVADIRLNTTNLAASAQDDQKKVSALSSAFGKFRFAGDVRVRGESFMQDATQDRNRGRIRAASNRMITIRQVSQPSRATRRSEQRVQMKFIHHAVDSVFAGKAVIRGQRSKVFFVG